MANRFDIDTKAAIKEMNALIDKFVDFKKTIEGTADSGKASFRKLETSISGLKKVTSDLVGEFVKLDKKYKNVSRSQKSFVTQTRNLKTLLKATRAQLAGVNAQLDRLKTKSKSGIFSGMLGSVRNIISALGILSGIQMFANAIRSAFRLTKELDSMEFSMKAVITNAVELANTTKFLRQITSDYGAELVTTTNRYIKFRAAATAAGLSAKETQKIFSTFTKVSGVLGLKTEELTGIYLALEQMISKGKITTEELRRQLGERLPGAMDIMANSLGVTTAKLDDMLKKGQVITKDVLPAFAKEVDKTFGLDKIRRVETLQAATSRLQNAWTLMIDDFREGSGAAEILADVINKLAENLGTVVKTGFDVIKMYVLYRVATNYAIINTAILTAKNTALIVINGLLSLSFWKDVIAITAFKVAILRASVASWTLVGSLRAVWAAMAANPALLLLGVITALYFSFRTLNKDMLETVETINKLSEKETKAIEVNHEMSASLFVLIERYKQLINARTELSKLEKIELGNVTEDIGKLAPLSVTGVDKFNRAINISVEAAEKQLNIMRNFSQAQAELELDIQVENLKLTEKQIGKVNSAFGQMIDGIGQVVKTADGIPKIFINIMTPVQDLTAAQRKLFNQWESGMLKNVAASKEMIIVLDEIASGRDADNTRMRLQIENMELINKAMDVQTGALKFTVDWYQKQIKEIRDLIEAKRLTNNEAKEELATIKKYQKAIDSIMGKESTRGTKRITQLRIVKDLLKEIENIQMGQQTTRLNIIADDPNIALDAREDAMIGSALTQIAIEKNIKDSIQQLNQQQFDREVIKTEAEIKLKKITVARKLELEQHLVNITEELRQKNLKAESLFANKIFNINKDLQDKRDKLVETRNQDRLDVIADESNLIIIGLSEAYEVERQLSEQRINVSQDVFEASAKNNRDLKKLEKVKNDEFELQTKNFKKLEREKLQVVKDVTREMIIAKIGVAQMKILNEDDVRTVEKLNQEINKLKASLEDIEKVVIDVDINKSDVLGVIGDIIGQVQMVTEEIGSMFDELSNQRIELIEAEIDSETNRFDKLIELYGNDASRQKSFEKQKLATLKRLNREKLKEEQKQARIRKAFALADIAMSTSRAILSIWADVPKVDFGISAGILTAFVSVLAAAQIATVLATPIPQYAEGSKGVIQKAHVGMINDARNQEYITRDGEVLTTKTKNALIQLKPGDEVHKDFDALKRNSVIMNSFTNGKEINETEFNRFFEGIESSIGKGFKKAKINNNINFHDKRQDSSYRDSQSRWSQHGRN